MLRKRFKIILLDQEMDFKKIPSKKNIFFGSKNIFETKFEKKIWFFFEKLIEKFDFVSRKYRHFRKSRISRFEIFWETIFFSDFFSKYFFSKMKKYFLMGFFLKSISWSRRIILKRYQSVSDVLKVRNSSKYTKFSFWQSLWWQRNISDNAELRSRFSRSSDVEPSSANPTGQKLTLRSGDFLPSY